MKNFSSWLIVMFGFMFWGFRLVGTLMVSMGSKFMFEPTDLNIEVVLLFVSFLCLCFMIKRRLWATMIYLVGQFYYFLPSFMNHFMAAGNGGIEMDAYMGVFFEFVGLILPLVALFDVLLDKNRKAHPTDKKTDWFYKNEQYDRKMDERSDKNNYRTL